MLRGMSGEWRRSGVSGESPGGDTEAFGGTSEVPGGRWLTVSEVAQLIGMSERSARDWVKRHDLLVNDARPLRVAEQAVRDQLAREHRTPRRTPEANGEVPGGTPEAFGGSEPIEAAYRVVGEVAAEVALVPLATMVEELRGLATQLNDMARRNEALALEVGQLRERQGGQAAQLTAQEQTIAELRRRAEMAEAQLARQQAEAVAQAAQGTAGAARALEQEEHAPQGWARLRRWWGGR